MTQFEVIRKFINAVEHLRKHNDTILGHLYVNNIHTRVINVRRKNLERIRNRDWIELLILQSSALEII